MSELLQHCLSMKAFNKETILRFLHTAKSFLDPQTLALKPQPLLLNKVVCLAFFEPSTRTRLTFELAAKHLGAHVIHFDESFSSLQKGESVFDTVDNLVAMGIDAFVIRAKQERLPMEIAQHLDHRATIINAGDGCNEHPTQALLDLLTIQEVKGRLSGLKIAILGDIQHSRVAGSLLTGLQTCDVHDIRLIGPKAFLPVGNAYAETQKYTDIKQGLTDVDVIIALRIQKERMSTIDYPDSDAYYRDYGLTPERLKFADPKAIVMHPGPMNRGVEIASPVADGRQSVILKQVRYGVALRMAIFKILLASE